MTTQITMGEAGLEVPDQPIIPFIEGDGIGPSGPAVKISSSVK